MTGGYTLTWKAGNRRPADGSALRPDALAGVVAVDVRLDHAADWDPGDIDPGYAMRLAAVRAGRRAEYDAATRHQEGK